MWPRYCEMLIGFWLAASPFVFRHPAEDVYLWASDFACAAAIFTFAALSFWTPVRRLHLAQFAVAFWLVGFGYLADENALPALQNNILTGLVLMMFALIPNEAARPPRSWRRYLQHGSSTLPVRTIR